jgi:uracil DNA glycosylase
MFWCDNGVRPPPSKLLKSDLKRELDDYTLENWAKQGILLPNTALKVQHKSPSSHMNGGRHLQN